MAGLSPGNFHASLPAMGEGMEGEGVVGGEERGRQREEREENGGWRREVGGEMEEEEGGERQGKRGEERKKAGGGRRGKQRWVGNRITEAVEGEGRRKRGRKLR